MTPDEAVIFAAEQVVAHELDLLTDVAISEVMRDHPCPRPGIDGAMVERGPRNGLCRYMAELMIPDAWPVYWRCPVHSTIEEWTPRT